MAETHCWQFQRAEARLLAVAQRASFESKTKIASVRLRTHYCTQEAIGSLSRSCSPVSVSSRSSPTDESVANPRVMDGVVADKVDKAEG